MARLAESVQVRPDLDEDGAGAAEIDARNRLQQPQGALVIGQGGPNASVHVRQRGVGAVVILHLHLQREQRQRVERGGQLLRNPFQRSPKTSENPVFVGRTVHLNRSDRVTKWLAGPETAGSTAGRVETQTGSLAPLITREMLTSGSPDRPATNQPPRGSSLACPGANPSTLRAVSLFLVGHSTCSHMPCPDPSPLPIISESLAS